MECSILSLFTPPVKGTARKFSGVLLDPLPLTLWRDPVDQPEAASKIFL